MEGWALCREANHDDATLGKERKAHFHTLEYHSGDISDAVAVLFLIQLGPRPYGAGGVR